MQPLDRGDTVRPQRRTSLIARELAHYRIDITSLSEMHLADEGSVCEPEDGCTSFWRGKAETENRIHRGGFAIHNTLLQQISGLTSSVNECLMMFHFPLPLIDMWLLSAYMPHTDWLQWWKEAFYECLDSFSKSIHADDRVILLGDFGVGSNHGSWKHLWVLTI